jgi:hypothetical protein
MIHNVRLYALCLRISVYLFTRTTFSWLLRIFIPTPIQDTHARTQTHTHTQAYRLYLTILGYIIYITTHTIYRTIILSVICTIQSSTDTLHHRSQISFTFWGGYTPSRVLHETNTAQIYKYSFSQTYDPSAKTGHNVITFERECKLFEKLGIYIFLNSAEVGTLYFQLQKNTTHFTKYGTEVYYTHHIQTKITQATIDWIRVQYKVTTVQLSFNTKQQTLQVNNISAISVLYMRILYTIYNMVFTGKLAKNMSFPLTKSHGNLT